MYNWGWTGKNNKTHNYFKQLYYTWRPTYSLHLAPNYTDLILAVQFLEIVKENLMWSANVRDRNKLHNNV